MTAGLTVQIEQWLARVGTDPAARDRLLALACERLRQLGSRMFRRGHALRRWEQSDDILQEALLRLSRALADVRPQTAAQFFALASLQIRRVLIDLSRKHFGPRGSGKNHASVPDADAVHAPADADLDDWTRFHEAVRELSEEARAAVDLLFYQGLSQEAAAGVLGVSERTVKRWWRAARQELHAALNGKWPAGDAT
jgi:RNA polymerase sigma-70 factor (ECF subfamily)